MSEMPHINLLLDGANAWPDLRDRVDSIFHVKNFSVAALPNGMQSGKPSLMIRIDLPNGKHVLLETSLQLWLTMGDALKAKFGDPRQES